MIERRNSVDKKAGSSTKESKSKRSVVGRRGRYKEEELSERRRVNEDEDRGPPILKNWHHPVLKTRRIHVES
jgi:hypothetical protein